jgi:hypothetical protein
MVTFPTPHPVEWVAPTPLWTSAMESSASDQTTAMRRPALLTIPADNFMDVLQRQLASDPTGLSALQAVPRSYRVRPPGKPDDWEPDPTTVPLKLYQAAHGHFNLVAASLICQIPGLPEHAVHPEQKEQVGFVIRRWDGSDEYAWVGDPSSGQSWQLVPRCTGGSLQSHEQMQPMFPVNYALSGKNRKLFVGVVPTSSVETYNQASSTASQPAQLPGGAPPPPTDALMTMAFDTRVAAPLVQLQDLTKTPDPGDTSPAPLAADGSPMVVLEFASFLNDWFPGSWSEITAGANPPSVNASLYGWLGGHFADQNSGVTWLDALTTVWAQREYLSGEASSPPLGHTPLQLNVAYMGDKPDDLRSLIGAARLETDGTTVPGGTNAVAPKLDPRATVFYVLRCIYRRPNCLLGGDIVGDRSEPFQIATFFDFDAPARPVTISLPRVTGVSDLRKFRKNVNFLISQELHNQIDKIIDLPNTLKGQFNSPSAAGGLQVGWICSFSIPIITICALFVLIMFVILLNIVFWWLPFFEICLPVPRE